jgi:hypothetical protein
MALEGKSAAAVRKQHLLLEETGIKVDLCRRSHYALFFAVVLMKSESIFAA